jgi:hypothetical protein
MSDVKVKISADSAELKSGLQKAKGEVDKFGKETEGVFSSLGSKLAGVFAFGAVLSAARGLMDFSGALVDTADALNISIDSLQGLEGAFLQAGVNQETFRAGMSKLNQSIQDARDGNGKLIQDFGRLGVAWEDIRDKSPEKILYLIADGMKDAKDPTEALSSAMSVLGRSGKMLASELKQGGVAIKEHAEAVSKITPEQAKHIDAVGDAFSRAAIKAKVWGTESIFWLAKVAKATIEEGNAIVRNVIDGPQRTTRNFPFGPSHRLGPTLEELNGPTTQKEPDQYGPPIPPTDGNTTVNPLIAKQIEEAAKAVTEEMRKQQSIDYAIADGEADRAQALKDQLAEEKKITEEKERRYLEDAKERAQQQLDDRRSRSLQHELMSPDERRQEIRDERKEKRAQARLDRIRDRGDVDTRPGSRGRADEEKALAKNVDELTKQLKQIADKISKA